MNRLSALVTGIAQHEALYLLELDASGVPLAMLLFDLNPFFRIGSRVTVLFKESEVALAKKLSGEVSFSNRFSAIVTAITHGSILADVTLQSRAGEIDCIITMQSVIRLELKENDEVTVLIKASQISLEAHLDD
jgi:molybdate transport system regulatory protein